MGDLSAHVSVCVYVCVNDAILPAVSHAIPGTLFPETAKPANYRFVTNLRIKKGGVTFFVPRLARNESRERVNVEVVKFNSDEIVTSCCFHATCTHA